MRRSKKLVSNDILAPNVSSAALATFEILMLSTKFGHLFPQSQKFKKKMPF
jgi:hypothetical protein